MYYLPWWMQWAQATALIVISYLGSWIAFKQARIAAAKLNLDLYDKRFKVFDAARHFLGEFLVEGTVSPQNIADLSVGTADAVFLFDDGVVKFIDSLRKTGIGINGKTTRLKGMDNDDSQRGNVVDQLAILEEGLSDQVERLTELFKPYLKLGNI
jgi:hypothetical protein